MSFQKAHQYSNELGEVVIQSAEQTLSTSSGAFSFVLPPQFKEYRVLEVGFVTTNATGSNDTTVRFGTSGTPAELVTTTSAITIAAEQGVTYSTAGTFDFAGKAAANVDEDGVPFLSKGQQIQAEVVANADAATTAVFFARLAPNIEYKG